MKKGQPVAQVSLKVPGIHNVWNATAALALGDLLGIDIETMKKGLSEFSGADRRFEKKGEIGGVTIIDDYAASSHRDHGYAEGRQKLSAQKALVCLPAPYIHPYQGPNG